tara:strand:+ start:3000 stop:3278 length:279 start_codon:yes stop_codon:yes gene_type:complete
MDIETNQKKCMNTFSLERNHRIVPVVDRMLTHPNIKNIGKPKIIKEKDIFQFNTKEAKKPIKNTIKKKTKFDGGLDVNDSIGYKKPLKMKSY